jgi:hypothetical protein
MAARRSKKADELCAEHFPEGLAGIPADATQVSCEHGSWDVEPATPPPPVGTITGASEAPAGGEGGDAQGDAEKKDGE